MSIQSTYQNGSIPADKLKPIDTGQLLQKNARDSYMRMKSDAKKDGVTIDLTGKDSGYRPCGNKGDYTERSCSMGFTQWCAWEKYQAGKGNLASNPTTSKGCKSTHGWGLAIDVNRNKGARDWIKRNGEKYGWWWAGGTFSQIEDWHFEYDENKDTLLDESVDVDESGETTNGKALKIIGFSTIFLSVVGFAYGLYYFTRKK